MSLLTYFSLNADPEVALHINASTDSQLAAGKEQSTQSTSKLAVDFDCHSTMPKPTRITTIPIKAAGGML